MDATVDVDPAECLGRAIASDHGVSTTSEHPKVAVPDLKLWEGFMMKAGITPVLLQTHYSSKLLAVDIDFSLVSELSRDPTEASQLLTAAGITCVGHQMKIIKQAKKVGKHVELQTDDPVSPMNDDGQAFPTIPRQNHTILPASSSLVLLPSEERTKRKVHALPHMRSPSEMLFLLSSNPTSYSPATPNNPHPLSFLPMGSYLNNSNNNENLQTHPLEQSQEQKNENVSPSAAFKTPSTSAAPTNPNRHPSSNISSSNKAIRPQFTLPRATDWRQHGLWKVMGI